MDPQLAMIHIVFYSAAFATHACSATQAGIAAADVASTTPALSAVSGALSAAPTGFSSDARRVVASLAPAWQDRPGFSGHATLPQGLSLDPQPSSKGYVRNSAGPYGSAVVCWYLVAPHLEAHQNLASKQV